MPNSPETAPVLIGASTALTVSGTVFTSSLFTIRTEDGGRTARLVGQLTAGEAVLAAGEATVCTTVPSACVRSGENTNLEGMVRPATGAYFPCLIEVTTTNAIVVKSGAEIKVGAEVLINADYAVS